MKIDWVFFWCIIIMIVVATAVYVEVGLWQECRTDHSWFYCLRVLT